MISVNLWVENIVPVAFPFWDLCIRRDVCMYDTKHCINIDTLDLFSGGVEYCPLTVATFFYFEHAFHCKKFILFQEL